MTVKMFFNIEMLLTDVGYGRINFYSIDHSGQGDGKI